MTSDRSSNSTINGVDNIGDFCVRREDSLGFLTHNEPCAAEEALLSMQFKLGGSNTYERLCPVDDFVASSSPIGPALNACLAIQVHPLPLNF